MVVDFRLHYADQADTVYLQWLSSNGSMPLDHRNPFGDSLKS